MSEEILQGSDEWKMLRLGKVTASRVADVVAKTKTGWGASRANYMAQLIAERLTGTPAESYSNAAMQHGTDTEAEARAAYEFYQGVGVRKICFVPHPVIEQAGCSPDGLIGDEGLVELKCPNTSTHISTLLGDGAIDSKYLCQMQWQMACCGTSRQWCDFVSYDPRMPENMRLFIQRVHRDDKRIAELEREVAGFLLEMKGKLAALTDRYGLQDAA